jgi:hypothetical protein
MMGVGWVDGFAKTGDTHHRCVQRWVSPGFATSPLILQYSAASSGKLTAKLLKINSVETDKHSPIPISATAHPTLCDIQSAVMDRRDPFRLLDRDSVFQPML